MNWEEESVFWSQYVLNRDRLKQRRGQAMMNALHYAAPPLYDMITGTDADCFYRDEKIPLFRSTLGI